MKTVILDYKNIKSNSSSLALCLGYFDGVHLGHQKLIKIAQEDKEHEVGLLTFSENISKYINNGKSDEVLTSLDDRFKVLSRFNLDYYYVLKIDKDFLNLSPIGFINILLSMNVRKIYVGDDYRFGKNKEGDIDTLREYFDVVVIPALFDKNVKVGTSYIKELLESGDIEEANRLLGRNYMISGIITKGFKEGEKIGYPTMNVKMNDNYQLPLFGVYKVIAYVDNIPHIAIADVGIHPTVNMLEKPICEVHIPSYSSNDYGKNISVEFIKFIREEIHFDNEDNLAKQIRKDINSIL